MAGQSSYDRWKKQFRKKHFQDTEIRLGNEKLYINPAIKLVAAWTLFAILVVGTVVISKKISNKSPEGGEPKEPVTTAGEVLETTTQEVPPMQQETNPEITAFVEQYLTALVQCNMEALQALVVDANQFDEVVLQKRKEYITGYSNIQCYTKPGKTENTYIVYAVVSTQIKDVTSQPLSMHEFYLQKDEAGAWKHNNTTSQDSELEMYINLMDRSDEVVALMERVNQENDRMAGEDASLQSFYNMLKGK